MKVWITIVAALVASGASAQTAQETYNAGQNAYDNGDWATAVTQFRRALGQMKKNGRPAAAVRSRLAQALLISGKPEEAESEARQVPAIFAGLGIKKHEDLAEAYLTLAKLERFRAEDEKAIDYYRKAMDAADGPLLTKTLYRARIGLALTATTRDPAAAIAATDAALADQATVTSLEKQDQAEVYALRARATLSAGDAKAAAVYIEHALDLAGRTTEKVTVRQVRVRADAALVYGRLGNQENVRKYLTYSGAGHLPDNNWLTRAHTDLPVCGDDVRPDDVAVVEFAIDTDGRPLGAAAVYASRPGIVGAAFAQAIRNWRWEPSEVAKLNDFWRSSVRVELRCVKRPPLIGLSDSFGEAGTAWLAGQGAAIDLSDPAIDLNPLVKTPTTDAGRLVAAMVEAKRAKSQKDAEAALASVKAQLDAANAPADVRVYLMSEALNGVLGDRRMVEERASLLASMDARSDGARAAAWLRTEAALAAEGAGRLDEARTGLAGITALPATVLPAEDPIRVLAVLHLSLIDKRQGRAVDADQRLAAAGMSADQCSLLDVRPVARNTSISSRAFPTEAARWHFEGSVREAFDLTADGHVTGVRTVIAYPPFVFGPATEKAVSSFRYLPPTLGDQPLGCVGQTINVHYKMAS